MFPLTRDELVECVALLRAVRQGELDHVVIPEKPLDVLAQQIVAEAACEDWSVDAHYDLVRQAYPYRHAGPGRVRFRPDDAGAGDQHAARTNANVAPSRRGQRSNQRTTRRAIAAITSGGAIPDNADYRVCGAGGSGDRNC